MSTEAKVAAALEDYYANGGSGSVVTLLRTYEDLVADLKRQLTEARESEQKAWADAKALMEKLEAQARAAAFAEVIGWCEENGHRFMQSTGSNDKSILVSQIKAKFGEKA